MRARHVREAFVFDPKAVPDEAIRRVHSVMTVLGGAVVHGSAASLAR